MVISGGSAAPSSLSLCRCGDRTAPPVPPLLIIPLAIALPVDAGHDAPHHCQGRPGRDEAARDFHANLGGGDNPSTRCAAAMSVIFVIAMMRSLTTPRGLLPIAGRDFPLPLPLPPLPPLLRCASPSPPPSLFYASAKQCSLAWHMCGGGSPIQTRYYLSQSLLFLWRFHLVRSL